MTLRSRLIVNTDVKRIGKVDFVQYFGVRNPLSTASKRCTGGEWTEIRRPKRSVSLDNAVQNQGREVFELFRIGYASGKLRNALGSSETLWEAQNRSGKLRNALGSSETLWEA